MKKLLILVTLTVSLFSAEIEWLKYYEGMTKQENKPVFYALSASYCVYCEKNKKMMNEDKHLNSYIKKNFITVSEERDVEKVPEYLDTQLTPTYYVLDKKGNIIGEPLRGYQNKETLLKYLNLQFYKFKNGAKIK